jgi:hypothetical protein
MSFHRNSSKLFATTFALLTLSSGALFATTPLSPAFAGEGGNGGDGGNGGAGGDGGGGNENFDIFNNKPAHGGVTSTDPATGNVITIVGNADGSTTIFTKLPNGKVLRKDRPAPAAAPPPRRVFLYERHNRRAGTGVRFYDNGDGTATAETMDYRTGEIIGTSTFTGAKAASVLAQVR